MVVANDQKDWSSKCLMGEFAINSSINATTGYTPFKLNYGYMLQSGQHILTDTTSKVSNSLLSKPYGTC